MAEVINSQYLFRHAPDLLSVRNSQTVTVQAQAVMRMVGISGTSDKDIRAAQTRLVDAMQATMEASGQSNNLLRAADLGEAGTRLSGHISAENLHTIFTQNDHKDQLFYFRQAANGTLEAIPTQLRFPPQANGMLAMTKSEIATKLVEQYDAKLGTAKLFQVLESARSSHGNVWSHGSASGGIKNIANEVVNGAAPQEDLPDLDAKTNASEHKSGGADMPGKGTNISADISHEPHAGRGLSKLGLAGAGAVLWGAYTAAEASTGDLTDKAKVFGERAIEAVPFVTYAEKMAAGKFDEARLDAASQISIFAGFAREPEVQAVIDALPKDLQKLQQMQTDPKTPFIDRHLAEMQGFVIAAIEAGDVAKYNATSSELTVLAEKKLELKEVWSHNKEVFKEAAANPSTDWKLVVAQNPDLTAAAGARQLLIKAGISGVALDLAVSNIANNIGEGIPLQIGVNQQASQQQSQAQQQEQQSQAQWAQLAAALG